MYEYSPLVPEPAPKENLLCGLEFITTFIESRSIEAEGSHERLSLIGSRREVERLLMPFKTGTTADSHWTIEQHALEKAVDRYLIGKHKADLLKRTQYKNHGATLIHANEHDFMRGVKDLMTNKALTDEQRNNVERAFREVCPPLQGSPAR